MEFFDWSKGCVYLGSYVNIVPVFPEYDVLQSHSDPVASVAAISPGTNSARPPFLCCVSGAGTTDNVMKPAAAPDTGIPHGHYQETTAFNIIGECHLCEGFCPCSIT